MAFKVKKIKYKNINILNIQHFLTILETRILIYAAVNLKIAGPGPGEKYVKPGVDYVGPVAEKEKATLAASIERGLEKSPKEDRGREILEEALSFVQGDMDMEAQEEMPKEEEAMPEEKPMGLMSRRGTEDGI